MSFLWRTRWLQPPTPLRDGVSDLHAYHLLSIHSQSHLFKPLRLSYVPGKKKSPQSSRWETNTYITMKLLQGKIKPTWDRRVWGGSGGGILDLLLRKGDFPGGLVVKNLPANAGDLGLIPGWGRCPGEGNVNPLQYSCLGNPMDRGAWQTTIHGVSKELNRT